VVVLNQRALARQPGHRLTVANLRALLITQWRPVISFSIPVLAAGLLSLGWNGLRYGSIWDSGYVASESFSAPWLTGITGLLVGPARGIVWYSPVLLLGIGGVGWFWRQARWVLGVVLAITLVYVGVYGKWYMWHGGYSWGPRFLLPLLPFLALLMGPAWQGAVERQRWGRTGRLLIVLLVMLSTVVQWLGLLIPFSLVQDWLAATVEPLFAPETFVRLAYSPLLLQGRFLTLENIHLAWWRAGQFDWLGFLMPLAGIIVGLVLIRRQLKQSHTEQPVPDSPNWLYALALCVIALAMVTYYQAALSGADNRLAAERIRRGERAGDAILLLQPLATQQFANAYHGNLPTYGFFAQDAGDTDEASWLRRLEQRHPRLWVIPDATPPDQSVWERPLRQQNFLLQESRLADAEDHRLALYALANAQLLVETGLGTIFGDPALQGTTVSEANGWIRLKSYAVTAATQPGEEILLTLRWQSLRAVRADYHVFVHLLDADNEKIAQRDGQPVQWLRPTSTWQPGEEIVDHYGLLLPAETAGGDYTIAVGLYEPNSGQRLPISAGPRDFAIELGPITVKASR